MRERDRNTDTPNSHIFCPHANPETERGSYTQKLRHARPRRAHISAPKTRKHTHTHTKTDTNMNSPTHDETMETHKHTHTIRVTNLTPPIQTRGSYLNAHKSFEN
jgi:hypothetical protein